MYEYLKDISINFPEYRKICFSGGLFANVKLNKFINDLDLFDEIYIHPAMGDSGLSLGAALCKASDLEEIKSPIRMPNSFYGQYHTKEEWDSEIFLHRGKIFVEKFSLEKIGNLINNGYVIGTFIGKTEYGPRSLGNRSIIVKPTDPETHEKLNQKLKRTEIYYTIFILRAVIAKNQADQIMTLSDSQVYSNFESPFQSTYAGKFSI
jgi:carbamoyltransferase